METEHGQDYFGARYREPEPERCSCRRLTGDLCDWHRRDYLGAPRCGWGGNPNIANLSPRGKKWAKAIRSAS